MSGMRVASVFVVFLGALLLLVACGGRPVTASGRAHPTPPPDIHGSRTRPATLTWKVGETFTGRVSFDERDQGTVEDELKFTAQERFKVVRLRAGVTTFRVAVTSWRWQRNTSELLTTSLPPPFTFGAGVGGEIVSGVDWPLPSDLPLPGLDLFAAPLAAGTGWSRSDGEGAGLVYQAKAGSAPGATVLDWSVTRPRFTTSGEPITVSGRAEATVSSRYQRRGRTVTLRSTREEASFERTTQAAAGVTQETGTILETTALTPPSG